MSDALWGPLGVLAGAIVTAVALVVSERIKKRVQPVDVAVTTGKVWTDLATRLDGDLSACKAELNRMNTNAKARDLATWDYLEAHNDYDDTTDRLVRSLEQVALRVMAEDERNEYLVDARLWRDQRTAVDTSSRALRETLFR